MKVKLLQDSRREGKAGEIVEVSPDAARFLLSVGSAEIVRPEEKEAPEKAKKTTRKK